MIFKTHLTYDSTVFFYNFIVVIEMSSRWLIFCTDNIDVAYWRIEGNPQESEPQMDRLYLFGRNSIEENHKVSHT